MAEDMIRTYTLALEDRLQITLSAHHPIFNWLAEHVGSVINRTVKDAEGKPAYEKIHGSPSSTKGIELGEKILYFVQHSSVRKWACAGATEFPGTRSTL